MKRRVTIIVLALLMAWLLYRAVSPRPAPAPPSVAAMQFGIGGGRWYNR